MLHSNKVKNYQFLPMEFLIASSRDKSEYATVKF